MTESLIGGWPTPEIGLVEAADGSLYPFLLRVPVETVAVYAALVLMHQRGLTKLPTRSVMSSAVLARAFSHLGLSTELMSATVTVFRRDARTWLTAAGHVTDTPVINADGTSDAHLVVWTESCSRMVDLTAASAPELRPHHRGPTPFPVVVAVTNRTNLRGEPPLAQDRGPFIFSWLFTDQTPELHTLVPQDVALRVERAGLELAHQVLAQVRFVSGVRPLDPLYRAHPQLADLVAGTTHLPEPPASSFTVQATRRRKP